MSRTAYVLFAFIALLSLSSCTSVATSKISDLQKQSRVILFLPGYKGSQILDRKTKNVVWLSASQSLFGSRSLEATPDASKDSLISGPLLEGVGLFGSFFSRNVYGDWLNHLKKLEKDQTRVDVLPYDWRRDNLETVGLLAEKIRELRAQGVQTIDVVAHSMGGLVLAYYLRFGTNEGIEDWSGAKQIRHAVIINAPFRGSIKIVRDFRRGSVTGLNASLMSARAIRSFTSAFELLPSDPDFSQILNEDGVPLPVNFFLGSTWRKNAWGPHGLVDSGTEIGQFEDRLQKAENFVEYLNSTDFRPSTNKEASTKLLVIQSKGIPTEARCVFIPSYKHRLACNKADLEEAHSAIDPSQLFEDGDGSVLLHASQIPEAFSDALFTESQVFQGEHLGVLGETEVRRAAFQFLNQGSAL